MSTVGPRGSPQSLDNLNEGKGQKCIHPELGHREGWGGVATPCLVSLPKKPSGVGAILEKSPGLQRQTEQSAHLAQSHLVRIMLVFGSSPRTRLYPVDARI